MQVPIHPGEDQCEAGECPSPRRALMRGQAWRASVGKGKTEVIPGDAAEDRVTGHGDCHIWGPEDICPFTHPERCLSTPRADIG